MAAIRGARRRGAELIAGALTGLAGALVVAQAHADQVDDRVLHRDLDPLALAGEVALHERGKDADHAVHAGAGVADRRPDVGRRTVRKACDAHRPAHRLRDGLVALVVGVRSPRTEALDARVHQARVQLLHRLVAETQALEAARPEALDEHVALLQEGAADVPGPRALEVQGQAALVAIEGQIEEAVRVGPILARR